MEQRAIGRAGASLCLAVVVVLFAGAVAAPADMVVPREPAPSPDGGRIAFTYMGDIWVVPAGGGDAERVTDHEAYDSHPVWSPDGSKIAFESDRDGNGDVFVIPAEGGTPVQLTFRSSWDDLQCWDRDGSGLFFISSRDTTERELYRVVSEGGMPQRVIRDRAFNVSVSPDGRWIAYVRGRTPWWRKHYRGSASRDIWIRSRDGGESYRLVDWPGDDDRPMWGADGRTLYFQSERADSVANIWKLTLDLPAPGSDGAPSVVAAPTEVTRHEADGVQFAAISDDGTLIAYECGGSLWTLDVPSGKSVRLEVSAPSDLKWNDRLRMTKSSDCSEFVLSPDESEIAFVVRGEVYVASFDDGETGDAMRITDTPAREKDIAWMPDGKTLLFCSDREGNYDVFAVTSDEEGKPELSKALKRTLTRLTDSPDDDTRPVPSPTGDEIAYLNGDGYLWKMTADGADKEQMLPDAEILHFTWSPDSAWLALSRTTLGHKEDIFIMPASGGEAVNVTDHPNDDFEPQWSDDGKRLSYASRTDDGQYSLKYMWLTRDDYWKTDEEREEELEEADQGTDDSAGEDVEPSPVEVKIDFDGLNERVSTVMNMRGGYEFYAQTPDGHYYAFPSRTLSGTDLWIVDWKGDKLLQVTEGGGGGEKLHWDNDGSTCYYLTSGGTIGTVSIDPDGGDITRRGRVGFSAQVTVDVPAERRQMFNEAWRLLLNGFYDPNFHGVDWQAVRAHYEPMALAAYTEEEFRTVVREMLGELSASHLGIYKYGGGGVSTGLLGIRPYEDYDGPGLRVRDVIPDSPADRAGIKAGEYLLSVNGREIQPGENYYRLMADTAGDEVLVAVSGRPSSKDARDVRIRPVGGGTISRLTYEEWVKHNRSMVEEMSGGRLGYLHIAGMGLGNLLQFEEDLFAQGEGKDGLIVDIRGNGGGSVHDEILRYLDRRVYGYTASRTRPPSRNPLELYTQPLALLIDESCYSDAEIFPMGWKSLGLGPVVGTPTYGAVIGTNDVQLIDGTWFRVPGSGWYDVTGRNLENWGIEPDVRVDSTPEEGSRGEDVQLSRAVSVLMDKLER